ncbi:MAG: threonine/serine exporter family protein [Oscillospiraceae bacterium]
MSEQTIVTVTNGDIMTSDELLDISITLGYRLLESGAETYRVEESVTRILHAYGIPNTEVFAIPSCIITTIATRDGQSHTRMKRITTRGTNLNKVTMLNDLCRRICAKTPSYLDVKIELDTIINSKVYSPLLQLFAVALASFSFCIFFGGGMVDGLVAIVCGVLMKLVLNPMEKLHTNLFFQYVVGSAIVTCIAFTMVQLGIGNLVDKIVIGTLMNLVPGVALTNSMRDIIAGDLLAGIIKLTEAIMIAIAMALGTGIALYGLRLLV